MLKFILIFAAVAVCHGQEEPNRYWLYTKNGGTEPKEIANTGDMADVVPAHDIIILVHGLGGHKDSKFNTEITKELHKEGEYNVIVVDWKKAASHSHSISSQQARLVGRGLGDFLYSLIVNTPDVETTTNLESDIDTTPAAVTAAKLHIVGFGIGAHVAGIAARRLQSEVGLRVGRITGLDPSGKDWDRNSPRLRDTDANYVEVIHTDGTGLFANGIGTPIGDINFYANGGSNQPGCLSHDCSHNRAWELFAASILNDNLMGKPCSTVTQQNLNLCVGHRLHMGGTALTKTGDSSRYRVNTGRSYPFA